MLDQKTKQKNRKPLVVLSLNRSHGQDSLVHKTRQMPVMSQCLQKMDVYLHMDACEQAMSRQERNVKFIVHLQCCVNNRPKIGRMNHFMVAPHKKKNLAAAHFLRLKQCQQKYNVQPRCEMSVFVHVRVCVISVGACGIQRASCLLAWQCFP